MFAFPSFSLKLSCSGRVSEASSTISFRCEEYCDTHASTLSLEPSFAFCLSFPCVSPSPLLVSRAFFHARQKSAGREWAALISWRSYRSRTAWWARETRAETAVPGTNSARAVGFNSALSLANFYIYVRHRLNFKQPRSLFSPFDTSLILRRDFCGDRFNFFVQFA